MSTPKTSLERIEALESELAALKGNGGTPSALSPEIGNVIMNNQAALNEQVLNLLDRVGQLELANAALGKTIGAICGSLDKKNLVTGGEILQGISDFEDRSNRQRIQKAIAQKELSKIETSTPLSVVVCKEIFVPNENPSDIKVVSSYRDFNLSDPNVTPALKKDLTGKAVGEAISYDARGGKKIFTVLEVYAIAEEVQYEGEAGVNA